MKRLSSLATIVDTHGINKKSTSWDVTRQQSRTYYNVSGFSTPNYLTTYMYIYIQPYR